MAESPRVLIARQQLARITDTYQLTGFDRNIIDAYFKCGCIGPFPALTPDIQRRQQALEDAAQMDRVSEFVGPFTDQHESTTPPFNRNAHDPSIWGEQPALSEAPRYTEAPPAPLDAPGNGAPAALPPAIEPAPEQSDLGRELLLRLIAQMDESQFEAWLETASQEELEYVSLKGVFE